MERAFKDLLEELVSLQTEILNIQTEMLGTLVAMHAKLATIMLGVEELAQEKMPTYNMTSCSSTPPWLYNSCKEIGNKDND